MEGCIFIRERKMERVKSKKYEDDYYLSCFSDSEVYETSYEDRGKLYKSLLKEHGRCISKVYIDEGSISKCIGWVFLRKDRYEDTGGAFLCETWVELYSAPPTKTIEYHYL